MRYHYETEGTCSTDITLDIEDGVVHNVAFTGGCNGNLQGISRLVEGMTADRIESLCGGISCGGRPTSCPDQLARAVREASEAERRALAGSAV